MAIKEDKEFGNIFAGEERHAPNYQNPEPNTPIEKNVIDDLQKHINSSKHKLSKTNADLIQKMIVSGDYDDIIVEPDVPMVYRGLAFKTEEAYTNFLSTINLNVGHSTVSLKLPEKLKFSPINGRVATSWTKAATVARRFTINEWLDIKFGVILCVLVNDNPNKLFDLQFWYENVSGFNSDEKEVIGFGDILVDSIILIKD